MGVTHMLLVALMGITYGWQSDGGGGVEYIVQVSPSELREIDRLGEISSVIDPSVAGHVSRIKIRVGTESLPRETPSHLTRTSQLPNRSSQNGTASASDRAAIPIPEMFDRDRAIPIQAPGNSNVPQLATANQAASKVTAMMKPDPENGSAGPGFSFPGAANDNGRIPPPGTRSPDPNRQPTMPQFTGASSANNRATTTLGGPSTDPTQVRDQNWRGFAGPRQNGPSTTEVGSDNMRFTDPRTRIQSAINTASTSAGSANRESGGTFGRSPAGLTFPNQQTTNDNLARDRILTQQQQMEIDRRNEIGLGQDHTDQRVEFAGTDRQDSLFDRQQTNLDPTVNATDRRSTIDPRFQNDLRAQSESRLNGETDPNRRFTDEGSSAPDRRLTQVELQAGAWDIDRYGNLIDRNGRRISPPPQNTARTATGGTPDRTGDDRYEYSPPRTTLQQPMPTRSFANQNLRDPDPIGYERIQYADPRDDSRNDQYRPSLAMQNANRTGITGPLIDPERQTATREVRREPGSQSDRSSSGRSSLSEMPSTARSHVAAQPLFNGLLLLSFVANIYLMFWLKNLRLRFREMVAAKRVANSNAQPA